MKRSRKVIGRAIAILSGGLLILLCSIAAKLAIAVHQAPQPEAILVLGGGSGREEAAARLARYYPNLDVWVSSGDKSPDDAYAVFQMVGVSRKRIHLDYRATDTVTNFTTLVAQFKKRDIQHLYIVTSDFHIRRATVIATVVLGHSGIAFTPIAVPSDRPRESWLRIARDGGRSLVWIATGRTGGRVGLMLQDSLNLDQ